MVFTGCHDQSRGTASCQPHHEASPIAHTPLSPFLLHVCIRLRRCGVDRHALDALLARLVRSGIDADVGRARVRGHGSMLGRLAAVGVAGCIGSAVAVGCAVRSSLGFGPLTRCSGRRGGGTLLWASFFNCLSLAPRPPGVLVGILIVGVFFSVIRI